MLVNRSDITVPMLSSWTGSFIAKFLRVVDDFHLVALLEGHVAKL